MTHLKHLILLLTITAGMASTAQQVNNIRVSQEIDRVVIFYDLSGNTSDYYDVKVECSPDGGKSFNIFPVSLSGDLKSVKPGTGKRITWEVLQDQEELSSDKVVFRLIAVSDRPERLFSGNSGTFEDERDGHLYKWIKIGDLIWMAENLAYLPEVNLMTSSSNTFHHYYVYNYTGTDVNEAKQNINYKVYGVIYNLPAAWEACPAGWHLSLSGEWEKLARFISNESGPYRKIEGNWSMVGSHLKAGSGWQNQKNGSNDYGFSALPSGSFASNFSFNGIGKYCSWWALAKTANSYDAVEICIYGLGYDDKFLHKQCFSNRAFSTGSSVRCVKDY